MAAPVIEAHDLGVRFTLNARRSRRSLRDAVLRRNQPEHSEEFWAVRDVSFTVQKGEAVGLVGANGSGKSTLLKLVAGVLLPDVGHVRVRGGVAPLIELTGGFVGKLTARENIWLAAGLHGLSKAEIADRFDDIVDFAEIRDFLDTPYRHFSSGMKVRLGFSVVTQLDEPVVLVDEVLAVGDRKFKKKCYARLEDMLSGGKTLFLVSHSDTDLKRFCDRGLYMRGGRLVADTDVETALELYQADLGVGDDDDDGGRRKRRKKPGPP